MPSIEARITKVYRKTNREGEPTGWYAIETDHDKIKTLETKIAEKAQEARSFEEQNALVLVDYSESQGNPNPHVPGSYYMNRYYEKAGSLAEKPAQAEIPLAAAAPERAGYGYQTNPLDAWRMTLAASAKLAVETMPLMPVEQRTFDAQKRIALAWAHWIISTPSPAESSEADDIPF